MNTSRYCLPLVFGFALLLLTGPDSFAVLFRDTGDPTYNTSAPTGALTNSGWQFEGQWQSIFLGTPIAPHYFLAAQHIGGSVGNVFSLGGANYGATSYADSPDSDLRIWQVINTFPAYAPLYTNMNCVGQLMVVIGRGTQRGGAVIVNGATNGWYWGDWDYVQRWGENTVAASYNPYLYALFSETGVTNTCDVSKGDSSGGVYIQQGGVWALAGIIYGVDVVDTTNCVVTNAAMLDQRGTCYYPANDYTSPVPSGFTASSVPNDLYWINSVITPGGLVMTPIAATGWNANGVIGTAAPLTADMAGTWTYYATVAPGAPAGTGLPMGTMITSVYASNTTFSFQPVTATNNVLHLTSDGGTNNSSVTWTLNGPQPYGALSFLAAASVNGGITYPTVKINYANGAPSQTATLSLPNWTSAGKVACTSGQYVGNNPGSGGGYPNVGANVNLYQINVLTTDHTDPITSVTVTASNYGGGNNEMFFALSGAAAGAPSQSPTFKSITLSGNDVELTWATTGGTTNIVQAANGDLNNGFVNISSNLVIPGSGVVTNPYTDIGGATNASARFYRVRVGP